MAKPEILESQFDKLSRVNSETIIKELQTDNKILREKIENLLIDLERLSNEYSD